MILCPHCNQQKIGSGRLPPDVVMILPCPSCHEYSVVFRNKAIPVNKRILEKGTRKERIEHLAEIIEMFLELASPQLNENHLPQCQEKDIDSQDDFDSQEKEEKRRLWSTHYRSIEGHINGFQGPEKPITEDEVKQFIEKDLNSLDDPEIFKKYFGNIDNR